MSKLIDTMSFLRIGVSKKVESVEEVKPFHRTFWVISSRKDRYILVHFDT